VFRWTLALRLSSFLLLSFLLLSGCGPAVQVRTAQDPAADHQNYRTFAMLEPNKPVPSKNTEVDPFVLLRLRQFTYLKMRALGFVPAAKKEADLIVSVGAARDQQIYVYNSGPYFYDPFYGPRWSNYVTRVDEGIVVIDLIDRKKESVVWRGTGVRSVGRTFVDEDLHEMVAAVLDRYPAALRSPQ
jgi:hypothetical protein